jgi:hypothetical protein
MVSEEPQLEKAPQAPDESLRPKPGNDDLAPSMEDSHDCTMGPPSDVITQQHPPYASLLRLLERPPPEAHARQQVFHGMDDEYVGVVAYGSGTD